MQDESKVLTFIAHRVPIETVQENLATRLLSCLGLKGLGSSRDFRLPTITNF